MKIIIITNDAVWLLFPFQLLRKDGISKDQYKLMVFDADIWGITV